MTTVWQDTGRTIPGDWGEPVAVVDDSAAGIAGKVARPTVQANAALRWKLGRAPKGGRRNIINGSNNYDTTRLTLSAPIVTANAGLAPDGTMTATLYEVAAGETAFSIRNFGPLSSNGVARAASIHVKPLQSGSGRLRIGHQSRDTGGLNLSSLETDIATASGQTGLNSDLEALEDGWLRFGHGYLPTEEVEQRVRVENAAAGDKFLIWGSQVENSEKTTPYQRVRSVFDITEAGVPSYPYLRGDLVDDVLPVAFPDGGTFDVALFGRSGSWVVRDVTIAPAGTLNIGPTTVTNGLAGLLAAVGDLVGYVVLDRTISSAELGLLVQYHKARGAKGLLVPGPELVPDAGDPFETVDSFDITGSAVSASIVSGALRLDSGGSGYAAAQTVPVEAGRAYLIQTTGSLVSGAVPNLEYASSNLVGTSSADLVAANNFSQNRVFLPTVTRSSGVLRARLNSPSASVYDILSMSMRELRPEEDW